MPKSKRNRAVTLSKTKKKGMGHKEAIVESIREAVDKYTPAYVFTFENMRNLKFKQFRDRLKSTSRFFLGSNKVMQIALGRSVVNEIKPGIYKVSKSSRRVLSVEDTVEDTVEDNAELDASLQVELKEGPLVEFTHEMKPFLRKQGMSVRLNKGVVELVSDFVVCEEGKPLSPEASRILRLLGNQMATFKLKLVCRWSNEEFELYEEGLDESDVELS